MVNENWVVNSILNLQEEGGGGLIHHAARHAKTGTDPVTPDSIGAAESSHKHTHSDITDTLDASQIPVLDASKITTGTFDISLIPKAALERLKIVADETARQALTKDDVQNGDVVKVTAINAMYYVKDEDKLGTEEWQSAYEPFSSGTASAVEWANVLNKVNASKNVDGLMTSAEFNKLEGIEEGAKANVQSDYKEEDETKDSFIKNKPTLGTASAKNFTEKIGDTTDLITSGAVNAISMSIMKDLENHTSDTANPHKVDKSQVGLSNVDNTADMEKPLSNPQQAAIDKLTKELTREFYSVGHNILLKGVYDEAPESWSGTGNNLVFGQDSTQTKIIVVEEGKVVSEHPPIPGEIYEDGSGKTYVFTTVAESDVNDSISEIYGGLRRQPILVFPSNHYILGKMKFELVGTDNAKMAAYTGRTGSALSKTEFKGTSEIFTIPSKVNQIHYSIEAGETDRTSSSAKIGFILNE